MNKSYTVRSLILSHPKSDVLVRRDCPVAEFTCGSMHDVREYYADYIPEGWQLWAHSEEFPPR